MTETYVQTKRKNETPGRPSEAENLKTVPIQTSNATHKLAGHHTVGVGQTVRPSCESAVFSDLRITVSP